LFGMPFVGAKESLRQNRRRQERQDRWRDKYMQHEQRLQKPIKRLSARELLGSIGDDV